MNQPLPHREDFASQFDRTTIAVVLGAAALQILIVRFFGAIGQLEHAWPVSILIFLTAFGYLARDFRRLSDAEKATWLAPWKSPMPWIVIGLLLVQIISYPPMMHDSLSYRLPRIFFALQEGSFDSFETADWRMVTMPIGWESLALPFATFDLIGWSRLIALSCWAAVYHLCVRMVQGAGAGPAKSRWAGLAVATAPFLVLQAASTANDILAATFLLGGAWLALDFERRPGPVAVLGSLLAVILAASAKPQFLVLGAAWLVWWLFAAGAPYRRASWWLLGAAFPLYVLVSPLPELVTNLVNHGSLVGGNTSLQASSIPSWRMTLAGVFQFGGSQFQLPVFPGADSFNGLIAQIPGMSALGEGISKFHPGVNLIPKIDGASFGLLHALLLIVGGVTAWRHRPTLTRAWFIVVAACFLIACSQVVAATMSRSFLGFFFVLIPLACGGLGRLADVRGFRSCCLIPILGGIAVLILNPSAPLWPAKTFAAALDRPAITTTVERYLSYQDRAETAAGMLEPVPPDEEVGLLIRGVTPVVRLWQPEWKRLRLFYVNAMPPEEFVESRADWLLIAANAEEMHPEAFAEYRDLDGWRPVLTRSYQPTLRHGDEEWTLYTRKPISPEPSWKLPEN